MGVADVGNMIYSGDLLPKVRKYVYYDELIEKLGVPAAIAIKGFISCGQWESGDEMGGVRSLVLQPKSLKGIIEITLNLKRRSFIIWHYADTSIEEYLDWTPKEAVMASANGDYWSLIFEEHYQPHRVLTKFLEE